MPKLHERVLRHCSNASKAHVDYRLERLSVKPRDAASVHFEEAVGRLRVRRFGSNFEFEEGMEGSNGVDLGTVSAYMGENGSF
jgi:hypothetical protein